MTRKSLAGKPNYQLPHSDGKRPAKPSGFNPQINRHTGEPHEHARQMARIARTA